MKYYLCCDNQPIDLSQLSYFKDKNVYDILTIVKFCNMFECDEDLVMYLQKHGLITDLDFTSFNIYLDKKYRGERYFKMVPNSDVPLYSDSSKYFNPSYLSSFLNHNFKKPALMKRIMDHYGNRLYCASNLNEINDYVHNPNVYLNSDAEEIRHNFEFFIHKEIYDKGKIKSRGLADLAFIVIDFLKMPKPITINDLPKATEEDEEDNTHEDFLEVNDFVVYNPGLKGIALEEAKEEEEEFRERIAKIIH